MGYNPAMNQPPSPLETEQVYLTANAFKSARSNNVSVIRPDMDTIMAINHTVRYMEGGKYAEFALAGDDLLNAAFVVRWLKSGLASFSKWDARFHKTGRNTQYHPSIDLSYRAGSPSTTVPKHALEARKVVEMSWRNWNEEATGERLASTLLYPVDEPLLNSPGHTAKDIGGNVVSTLLTSKSDEDRFRGGLIEEIGRQFPVAFHISTK